MIKRRRRGAALGILGFYLGLLGLGLASAPAASAQSSDLVVQTRSVRFLPNGHTQVTVSVTGPAVTTALDRSNFTITENGEPVTGVTVSPLHGPSGRPVAVALLFDVSGSSQGAQLAIAKTVAKQFMSELPLETRIAVVSFGSPPAVLIDFTEDRGQSTLAINTLQARGRGAIWDAIVATTRLLQKQPGTQGNLVMFSDGQDTASERSLEDAVQALKDVQAPITAVTLAGERPNDAALSALAAAVPGGSFHSREDLASVDASLREVAQEIVSQYVLTYPSEALTPKQLAVEVTARVGGATASSTLTTENLRQPVKVPEAKSRPLLPALASRFGLYLGAGAIFVLLMLFFAYPLTRPPTKQVERALQRSIQAYENPELTGRRRRRKEKAQQGEVTGGNFFVRSSFGARAVVFASKVPRPKDYDERMQKLLDKAGWPLRSTEFIVIQIAGVAAGVLLGAALLQDVLYGIVLVAIGAITPRMILTSKISKRESTFLSQLPETLQLLAGSLQAGYGFLQALDTVSKESPQPTGGEFARVLAEARLGMPVEEALENMSERVGGEDFRWVVIAVNIQRQVGGNLAALLHTVSQTLREREAVRRQIKTLSAEGRLSAIILTALPFVLFGYLSMINPEYLGQLTGSSIGKLAIVIALVLIGLGILWMRKIIKIDV